MLPTTLKNKVVGQGEAIEKITKAIKRNRTGLKDTNKPIGSFIFLGSTGVGKTELAKELCNILFGSKDKMVRLDMSEYMESFTTTRLIGSPPGYVGYGEGGELTEKVRRNPYTVVLFDEIEKAHPEVFNLLLQILDDGHITDSLGVKINFSNTIIIMTSNIGVREFHESGLGVGFGTSHKPEKNIEEAINTSLKKYFAPEFLNRLDDIIIFNSLKKKDLISIIDIELDKLAKKLKDLDYKISISQEVKEYLIEEGYDEKYGARPLKRVIQKYIEDELADEMLKEDVLGKDIEVGMKKNKIIFNFNDE